MNRDFVEMLSELSVAGVDFMVVGAHAVAAHGCPRATGDLDIWVRPSRDNAARVLSAIERFGAPLSDLTREDLERPGTVFQIGVVPSRIDLLTTISGVVFDEAWPRKSFVRIEQLSVPVIGRLDLFTNKRAAGRPKDLADLAALEEQASRE